MAEKIQREMKDEFEKDFCKSVRETIQMVMSKYKLKFDRQPIWQTIVEFLPAELVLSKSLRRHKAESIGNIPRGRDALDLQKILEGLLSSGGDRVKYLDSNELLESNPNLQATLQQYLVGEIIHPERVLLLTTDQPSLPSPGLLHDERGTSTNVHKRARTSKHEQTKRTISTMKRNFIRNKTLR